MIPIAAPTPAESRMTAGKSFQPEPGADRGEQLEVAEAHAFLAGQQPEQPVHGPENEIARDRADDRGVEVGEGAEQIEQKAGP